MDLQTYLIVGSYLMGAGSWMMLWRELQRTRKEIVQLRLDLAEQRGLDEGQEHELRLTRLERLLYHAQGAASRDS